MRKQHAINPGRSLLLCCCILLLPAFVRAHESAGRESILIISSYNPDTRRMSSFITEFEQRIVASGVPCDIYVETLECKGIADAPQWISQIDNLISRYEGRSLRAIVLLGQEAWASFVSLGRIPDGVLCFSCFASENGVMLPAPSDSLQTWKPRAVDYQAMGDSLNRVGGMLNRYDIRRNIELIRSLYPQVENIALVTDNTYGGISLQALVREEWENYPDLNLVLVDSREGEETAFRTFATLPPRSAVMLGTWRVGSDGEYFMQRSLNDLVQNNLRVPVFSVTGTGIGDMAIGGYVPEYENGAEIIAGQIRKYYDTDSIEDAHFHTSKSLYLFDSRKLKEWKIAEYALPKGSVIEDTMAAKLSKYSHYIELLVLGILLLVLLLFFVTWLLLRMRRLKLTLEEREGQLVVAREKAEESDMLKSAFLANMSHEIRTPLNAIVGFSELLANENRDETRREYTDIILRNNTLLLQIISDVLDLARIESGRMDIERTQFDARDLCREIADSLRLQRRPGVELRVEEGLPELFITEYRQGLAQVLNNFTRNALKFTGKGSVTIGFRRIPGHIRFYVRDTGIGIAPEDRERIFERFVKLDTFTQGTGLGLSICKSIAEQLGGSVGVDSVTGEGSCFRIDIPSGE